MNRTTALFLALAILLAHTLAIHTGLEQGWLAPPYDQAHVAYRVARNFVETGSFAWDPSLPAAESYPSILWVFVAAVAERLQARVTTFCQWIGVASALSCVLVLARFSPERLAGVIAPLLFVVCGGIAAAAANGMETAVFALLVTASFLAFERRQRALLAVMLALACLTRPEGQLFALALFVLELSRTRSGPLAHELRPYLAPLAVAAAIVATRHALIGQWVSPWTAALFDPGFTERWLQGLTFLRDFLVGSGWTILILFPLYYALRGTLRGLGLRALLLALFWAAIAVASGGDSLPFAQALAPMFAILMVAIQEAMTHALDSKRRGWPSVVWASFFVALFLSALASRFPGNLGPLPLEALQRKWMVSHTTPRFGYEQPLGRMGLAEEIDSTARQRSVGLFLRDQIDPRHKVLTPWPGAMGYLSRGPVVDLLGRTSVPPGASRPRSWAGIPRVDILSALESRPAYIVPSLLRAKAPNVLDVVDSWIKGVDVETEDVDRLSTLRSIIQEYELIAVPIPFGNLNMQRQVKRPFYLLRRSDLGLRPQLRIVVDRRRFSVEAVNHDRGHEQIVDLRILLKDKDDQLWSMLPTGGWEPNRHALARTSIVLFPASSAVQLVSGFLPENYEGGLLTAVLRTAGASGEKPFAFASEEEKLQLP